MAPTIDGKPIDEIAIDAIVVGASNPARPFFAGGNWMDYNRNRELLRLFDGCDELDAAAAFEQYRKIASTHVSSITGRRFSGSFEALRAGELLAWATVNRLVERLEGPRWRIIVREAHWELCGPERHQVPVRVRGLTGPDASAASKTWHRELKRRERARVKHVNALIDGIRTMILFVGQHAPETKLSDQLKQFGVGEVDTLAGAMQIILDAMVTLLAPDAMLLREHVACFTTRLLPQLSHRRALREADMEALAGLPPLSRPSC